MTKLAERRFRPWQGPIVGALVIIVMGLLPNGRERPVITAQWVAGHALVGALIGLLVALCDGSDARSGTVVSRFLALISPATAVMPVFGLPFNTAAWLANRRFPGPLRTLALVTLVVGVVWSVTFAVLLFAVSAPNVR